MNTKRAKAKLEKATTLKKIANGTESLCTSQPVAAQGNSRNNMNQNSRDQNSHYNSTRQSAAAYPRNKVTFSPWWDPKRPANLEAVLEGALQRIEVSWIEA